MVVFGQKLLYSVKSGSIRAIRLYSAKKVVFGKVVVIGQGGSIRSK